MPTEESKKRDSMRRMLNPASIAVVGATERPQYGGRFVRSVLQAQGRVRVYPVNPRYKELLGVRCYSKLSDLPESPDLVGIIVPYHQVLPVIQESAQVGAGSAIIVSAGFSERGDAERSELQEQIKRLAEASGVRTCGPNCLGAALVQQGVWPSSTPPDPRLKPGPIALVSQSGASAFGPLMTRAIDMGIGYSHIISTGNEADLESSDFIRYLLDEPEVRVVACFIEGLKDGRKFLDVARVALERGKSIVLIKVGRSGVGAKAARSHTAALTGSDAVHNAVFKQFGVVRSDDYDDLIQTAHLMAQAPPPAGDGVTIVSHSGGISSLIADHLGHAGLPIPPLTDRTAHGLSRILGGFGWASNPADITGLANREEFGDVLALLESEPNTGALVIATAGNTAQAQTVLNLKKQSRKPLIFLSTGGDGTTQGLAKLRAGNVPLFTSPSRLAKGLRGFFDYHQRRKETIENADTATAHLRPASRPLPPLPEGNATLTEHDAKALLSNWGIPSTREVRAYSLVEAIEASATIGFPLALKLESPHIPHKTDAGVVRLDIRNVEQLSAAYGEIAANSLQNSPRSQGSPVLVQEMVTGGVEVIVGLSQDAQFGPIILFGLGGTLVEVYHDVTMRACPISEKDAREMVRDVRGAKLLNGFRGGPEGDVEALVDVLLSVSRIAVELAHRKPDLDINPLMVLPKGQGVKAVDALMTLAL